MTSLIHRLLLLLPPEMAHRIAMWGLRVKQRCHYQLLRRRSQASESVVLQYAGKSLRFANRLGLAAGLDKNAETFPAFFQMGFGFIEVGTVTPLPQSGNPRPRLWRVPGRSLVNAMGFNNCGVKKFAQNIRRARSWVLAPLFANIGKNKVTENADALSDYKKSLTQLTGLVDGFVINLSSPNTPGLRDLQSREFISAIAREIPAHHWAFVKLAPDLTDEALKDLCEAVALENALCGVILTNTSRSIAEEKGFKIGGFSGPALLARSLSCVRLARQILGPEKLIIGVGGISSVLDYQRMREAGADLVEIYTSFVYGGEKLVRELASHAD